MEKTIMTSEYYKVKWEIGKKEKIVISILLFIFNVIELFLTFGGKNAHSALLVLIFFDVVLGALYYIGYRLPCVKWDINWKKQEDEVDITEKQKKYRMIINAVIVCVMIVGIIQTLVVNSIVINR